MWHLAWRHVVYYRGQTLLLVAAIALAGFLPIATELLLRRLQHDLRSRAAAPPLVVGKLGSRTDLMLHALYFTAKAPGRIPFGTIETVTADGYARAIPLAAVHTAKRVSLVGTSLDYFDYRRLRVSSGRLFGRLGECVLGASVARRLGLSPGDSLLTDTESFVELTRYPLKLRVVGVLAAAGTPDDDAVFCDIKTVWVIEGIGHGHQDLRGVDDPGVVLERTESAVTAGAALKQYLEITPENEASFHFHGDMRDFPITAVLLIPRDEKSETILLGRWQDSSEFQVIEPDRVVESLLGTVFQVKHLLDLAAVFVAVSTGLLMALVVLLSLRLRAAEMATLFKLGCRRATTARLISAELLMVTGLSAAVLVVMLGITWLVGPSLLRWWIVSGGV